jgi:DNA-directed RNA polymerase subunit RPC12/RpoP
VQVLCPQCGAPVEALTESRFYRCPFCASSFVVHEGKGLAEYTFRHVRDNRQAWSALTSYLETSLFTDPFEQISVDFLGFPFWMFSRNGDRRRLIPAMEHPFPEISHVTLPAGDLVFLKDTGEYPEPSLSPTQAMERIPADERTGTWSLVFLPLYFLKYQASGQSYTAIVSGPDGRVFASGHPEPTGTRLPVRHVVMIVCFTLLLIIEGLLVRDYLMRAGAFLLSFALFYPVYRMQLKKEILT